MRTSTSGIHARRTGSHYTVEAHSQLLFDKILCLKELAAG
jgi:hypothetical protein